MSAELAHRAMVNVGVKVVCAVPDSMLAPLELRLSRSREIEYIPAAHEATCVGIVAGLQLAGVRSLILMENSGLRSACESLARLHLSHHLFTCSLISHRGAFGERNWWGIAHEPTMIPLLTTLNIRSQPVGSVADLEQALDDAFNLLAAGQTGVALLAEPSFCKELLS